MITIIIRQIVDSKLYKTPFSAVPASLCEWLPPAPPICPAQLPLLSVFEITYNKQRALN